jgi:hypothetical protein
LQGSPWRVGLTLKATSATSNVAHCQKEGIGLGEVLSRVTMQVFVREHFTMIPTPSNVTLTEYRSVHYVGLPTIIGLRQS